ncbi:hypothetical protein ORD22_08175 [Sporosarcina sp. GW1-11]|uniref:S24 family peptidase n=1 Tax=Sporosarcina sp. GW1-11 TaxID=2899126 RepID=UPI00294DB4C8|nr:S24 family peptidase [Sporosarcina sp. GW1-11]MDV6378223.1 hypothetical protein [Sporosarcina sp. GW1-11]
MKIYHDLLRDSISRSRLSLADISDQLIDMGFSTKKDYLSKLQNGKIPPARDDLNTALARILDIDENELILSAHLAKSPQAFKNIISEYNQLGRLLTDSIKQLFTTFSVEKLLSQEDIKSLVADGFTIHEPDLFLTEIKEKMSSLDKWTLYQSAIQKFEIKYEETDSVSEKLSVSLTELEKIYSEQNKQTVPFYTKMYRDYYVDPIDFIRDEVIDLKEDYQELYENGDLFFLEAFDDGMDMEGIGAREKLLIAKQKDFTSTDVVLLTIDDQQAIARRLQSEEDSYLIRTANPLYPAMIYHKDRVSILGKVISVHKEINFD